LRVCSPPRKRFRGLLRKQAVSPLALVWVTSSQSIFWVRRWVLVASFTQWFDSGVLLGEVKKLRLAVVLFWWSLGFCFGG
jgi:hypothetical protein